MDTTNSAHFASIHGCTDGLVVIPEKLCGWICHLQRSRSGSKALSGCCWKYWRLSEKYCVQTME
jgi:hypothetical protein